MSKKDSKNEDRKKCKGKDKEKDESRKKSGKTHASQDEVSTLADELRVPVGRPVDLASYDPKATPGGPADKAAGLKDTARMGEHLADLQERLWAASTAGDHRRLLLVLQGMDTSGKGGTVKHVIGLFNPSGCRISAFKAPTPEERRHDFLWRIKRALPTPARSASSTAPTTRTSSSPASATSPRTARSTTATAGSTASRSPSPTTA